MQSGFRLFAFGLISIYLLFHSFAAHAVGENFDVSQIDDTPKVRDIEYPDWFQNSFLNLQEDLAEALYNGKKGIIVYFGQKDCPYCEALIEINFGRETDIISYTREHFEIIPIDIWGDREVTDFDGTVYSEKKFAESKKAHFTPSMIFYGEEGKKLLQLRGYHTPYKMRAALGYVAEGFYKQESLRDYMARADPPTKDSKTGMNTQDFFGRPPFNLDRTRFPGQLPLAVFFEQGNCHACDVLHTQPLADVKARKLLNNFEVMQLNMWDDTRVVTPSGHKMTAKQWANQLGLYYAPSILFFDEEGFEVFRISSVVKVFRLRAVLEYILAKGYEKSPTFERWREDNSDE